MLDAEKKCHMDAAKRAGAASRCAEHEMTPEPVLNETRHGWQVGFRACCDAAHEAAGEALVRELQRR